MSDFGAVYDYALALEASVPAAAMAELEKSRPAVLGLTKRQKEEAAKLAAMSSEDRAKAEAQAAHQAEQAAAHPAAATAAPETPRAGSKKD